MSTKAIRLELACRRLQIRFLWIPAALLLSTVTTCLSLAQIHDVVCSNGDGRFQAEFRSGVGVQVRAARAGELATRNCEVTLNWTKNSLMVARNVPQVDVDTFGVDLGLGVPVTTFQVKKTADDCCMEYQVYSLEKAPLLLRAVSGGDFFTAADIDLDGRIAIWTHDAAAIEGFERLNIAEFDSAPTIVLRFEHGKLLDVSSEFQDYFDREIEGLRKELDSDGLRDFKNTDGKLSPNTSLPVERLHRLRNVKAKVLEIVWNYLYSGRQEPAWRALSEMWPTPDLARIQTAMMKVHSRGIRAQIDGETSNRPLKRQKKVQIFDAITTSRSGKLEITPPQPIMLRRPPLQGTQSKDLAQSESLLLLVIDSAGKVRSAEPAGKTQRVDQEVINAAYSWKFIPAFRDGRAVASRIRMAESPRQ